MCSCFKKVHWKTAIYATVYKLYTLEDLRGANERYNYSIKAYHDACKTTQDAIFMCDIPKYRVERRKRDDLHDDYIFAKIDLEKIERNYKRQQSMGVKV